MRMIDYELICDICCLFEKKIFIYGTGLYGGKVGTVISQMGIEINGFCETNPGEGEFLGKKVLSTETVIRDYDESDVLVIVASAGYYKEMLHELRTVENMAVCTYYALFMSVYLNYETEGITESLKNRVKFLKKASLEVAVRDFLKYGMTWFCNALSQPSGIWLYQPGKVASLTIYWSSSLKMCHLHSLAYAFNADGMSDMCRDMITELKKKPIKIITGVREPIARDISLFFESTERDIWPLAYYCNYMNLFGDYSKNNKLDIPTLRKRICTFEKSLNYSFGCLGKDIVENKSDEFSWFDYEIKALFGVDIYAYPFDREKGYTIIKQDNIQILVYKCEKLNQLEKVISEFLEDPEFSFNNVNQGDKKVYSYVYKKFKDEVKLSKQYFDYYYAENCKLKHFYTDSEIEQFADKWKKKLSEEPV